MRRQEHSRHCWCCAAVLALLGAAASGTSGGEVRLDATTTATIALAAGSPPDLREAAAELAQRLREATGATAAVQDYAPGVKGAVIHVGVTDLVKRQALDLQSLDLESFVIKTIGDGLILAGRTDLGSRHAVYAFLERHVGVRWYFPGELGTFVPPPRALVLKDLDERETPAYLARYVTLHGREDARLWERRNRMQNHWTVRLKGNSHSMTRFIPAEKYGKDHPEYFAMRRGARNVPQTRQQEVRADYCLTNPDVARICAEVAIQHFAAHPQETGLSMAMNDTGAHCECPSCLAEGQVDAVNAPNYTDRYFSFVNRVARMVREKHPDRFVGVLAYGAASKPPFRLKRIEDNVNVYLVVSRSADYDRPRREATREVIRQWTAFTPNLCLYDYMFGSSGNRFYQVPTFYPRLMADSFLFAWKQGVRGQVIEMLPVWNFDPKAWLAARLLWNPQASPDDLIEGFCRDMFGPAAPAMRQYFAMLEDAWMAQPLPVRSTSSSESQYGIIQPRLNDLDARLKDALGQASTPLEKRRVQFFADGLRTTALFIQSYETVRRLNPFPATPVEVFSALEGVAELRRSEDAAAAHLRALKEQCGIGPEVIAPRDRAPLIKAVLDRCVRRLAAQGFVREAEALKAGDLEAVLKARPALAAAGRLKETPPAKPGPEAVLIEEVRTPAVGEAKLLLHEPFESAADVEAHGGVIDGDADFVEGIRGRAAYLNGPFSCVLFPNDRLNPSAGTIEFALKTRWAGRDEEFSHMLFGTQGNLDPPGHVSISISGPAGKRVLSTTVYYTTGSFYSRIPLTDWREDTWHHVAAVWRIDPTDPAKTFVRTYLDGQPSTDRPAGKAGEIRLAGTQFGVGNRPIQAGARAYPMIVVDELRIYDRPLSPEGFSFRKAKRPAAD